MENRFLQTHVNTKTWYWNNFEAYCIWIESNTHKNDISMFLTWNPKIDFVNYKTLNTWIGHQKKFFQIYEAQMYRWNLIYIKSCKLVLILSIHENHMYVHSKSKNWLTWKPNILNLCVCELKHINNIYLYTRSKYN